MTDKQIVLTTTGSDEEALRIAQHLVDQRLAACVNIIPQINSVYRWQDKVETAREWLLLIKTTSELFSSVRAAIGEIHSYEVPECIALTIDDGSPQYLQWIAESVKI